MEQDLLGEFVEAAAARWAVPGVAVGVWADGRELHVCHGVTSVENPLPVDRDTLFVLGSVTKTYTATALMCLVAQGRVQLDALVRRYVPELRLAQGAEAEVTVLHLLNHTSGLDWGFTADTGEGDDALAAYVARLAELGLVAPPGSRASYSQAGYNLAGRIVEKVTGLTFERAVASLVGEPLGLSHSFFFRDDVMTRRFVVGHNRGADGTQAVARLWRRWRGENPGGGLVSSAADQLRWARFHLGDGRVAGGERVLPAAVLAQMREPTVRLRASSLGDAIGIGWFLREVDGVRTVGHVGSANGQFAELLMVPERGFAVIALSNAGPGGVPLNQEIVRWALRTSVGLTLRDPEPLPYDDERAQEVVGRYANEVMTFVISEDGRALLAEVLMKPRIRAAADKELPPDYAPFRIGLLPGDEYVVADGGMQGQRGYFTRDATGVICGVDLAGRLFHRAGEGDRR